MIRFVDIPEFESDVANAVIESFDFFFLPFARVFASKRREVAAIVEAADGTVVRATSFFDLAHVFAIAGIHELEHVVRAVVLQHDRFGRAVEQDRFVFAGTSAVAVFTTRFFGRNPNVENGSAFEQFVREARQACGITIVFGQWANADRTTARKFDDDRLAFARFEDVFDLVVEKFTRLGF